MALSLLVSAICVISALAIHILDNRYVPKHAPNEPPVVRSYIPYIGHIIGLIRHGICYYQDLSSKNRLPIFTLNTLNSKIYVVAAPELINAVNRNSKTLAFNPFIAQLGKRITGHDKPTGHIIQHNLNGENGTGYVIVLHDRMVASLAPGKDLENMTGVMLQETFAYLKRLEQDNIIDLYAWSKSLMTICSTRAIYGPENPFSKDESLVDDFWQFDNDLNVLIADIAPSLLAPKGDRSRTKMALAFQHYFSDTNSGPTAGSGLAHARDSAATEHSISAPNKGRLEVGALLGILANTIPTTFYMLAHLFADPLLLSAIRSELERTCVSSSADPKTRCIHIMTVREKCPLLYSTFQELLRVRALGTGSRYVREDTLLNNQYLLKKGMIIQMPMAVMHGDPSVWGADASVFNPRRFLKQTGPKTNMSAYRPFGGGASLCPGRHFVALEIMALAACMVLRFDMQPVDGEWSIPAQKQVSLATNVFPPVGDVKVRVAKRNGWEDVQWGFSMS